MMMNDLTTTQRTFDPWLTVMQAAEYANVSRMTVMRAARRGALQGVKVNGARVWRFRREAVDQWLERHPEED